MKRYISLAIGIGVASLLNSCSNTPATGLDSSVARPQIVNGRESVPFSRPYQVRLSMGCGGTLISSEWVITAAHCRPRTTTTVRVGVHKLSSNEGETIRVTRVIVHPNFGRNNANGVIADIALLKLQRAVTNSNAAPAALPNATVMENAANTGKLLTVSGWGQTKPTNSPQANLLQEADLAVMDPNNGQCGGGDVICGDYTQNRSACYGDSGGPFATKYNNKFYVIGVVHGGPACQGWTSFTKTFSYLEWIKAQTGIEATAAQ